MDLALRLAMAAPCSVLKHALRELRAEQDTAMACTVRGN
jgi:hypothetical protein